LLVQLVKLVLFVVLLFFLTVLALGDVVEPSTTRLARGASAIATGGVDTGGGSILCGP
jgi:hypothetical protein